MALEDSLHTTTSIAPAPFPTPPAHGTPAANAQLQPADRTTTVSLLVDFDTPRSVATYAMQGWAWPSKAAKHLRHRAAPIGGACAAAAQREVLQFLEAWVPARPAPPAGTAPPAAGTAATATAATATAAAAGAWNLILSDDIELSEAMYVYVRHTLATTPPPLPSGRPPQHILGFALGAPVASSGGAGVARRGWLTRAASCGTVYTEAGWQALKAYAATIEPSSLVGSGTCNATGAGGGAPPPPPPLVGDTAGQVPPFPLAAKATAWAELQERFMAATGYALHYPGLSLCRRKGDGFTRLASGAEVAALLSGGLEV